MGLLTAEVLEQIKNNAAGYDAANVFCSEDFELLKEAGYLKAAVPKKFGGAGLSFLELTRHQRLLASYAPATALAANMHLLWNGVAKYLHERGDTRLDWVFEETMRGEIFAFGISEPGNDLVLLDSFSSAVEDTDSYLLTGTKIFTTLSPVWTRLGVHAKTESGDPQIIVGFIERELGASGQAAKDSQRPEITHPGEWNTLGMRATQSWNTRLQKYPLLKERVVASYAPMDASDPIVMGVSLAFGALTSSVYAGISDRAYEIVRESLTGSEKAKPKIDDPYLATLYTQGYLKHFAAVEALEKMASDIDHIENRDDFSVAIAALKNQVTDEAREAIDVAIRVQGSKSYSADSELSRLYRDVLAGIFHPRSATSLAASLRNAI